MARVIVVEDDFSLRRLLRRLLEGWGHEVRECEGAQSAIAAAGDPEALFLVDYPLSGTTLPEEEAAARLAIACQAGAGRVVYMTSHPAPPVRGAGYVVKPFGSGDLHSQLERAVRRAARK